MNRGVNRIASLLLFGHFINIMRQQAPLSLQNYL